MPLLNALLAKTPVAAPTDAVVAADPAATFQSLMPSPVAAAQPQAPALPAQAAASAHKPAMPTLPSLPAAAPMDVPPAAAIQASIRPEVATQPGRPALPLAAAQIVAATPAANAAAAKPLKITSPAAEPLAATKSEAAAAPEASVSVEATVAAEAPVAPASAPTADAQQILLGALMAAAGMPATPAPSPKASGASEPSLPAPASPVAAGRASIATPRNDAPGAKPLLEGLRPDFVANPGSAGFEMPLPVANQEPAPVIVQVPPQALLHAADPAANNVQFAPRVATEAPQVQIPVPATDPGFGAAVGERLAVVIGEGHHRAELRLDPPDLGTVSVQIDLKGDRASLNFVAPTEAARDALAQALPDLRNALASQGLSLTHTNIGSESRPQAQPNPERTDGSRGNEARADAEQVPQRILRRGLVDDYA